MRRQATIGGVVAAGLLVAFLLAFVVSPHASSSPDALERVAADKGLDSDVRGHALGDSPLADYAVTGIDDSGLSTGVAGIVGVTVTFGLAFAVSKLAKPPRSSDLAEPPAA